MATFKDTHEVYAVQGGFLDWITKDEILRPKFVKANTSFMVNYSDPAARILVDCTQDPPVVACDPPADTAAEIDLKMGADEGHPFWQGKPNLPAAMARPEGAIRAPLPPGPYSVPGVWPPCPSFTA